MNHQTGTMLYFHCTPIIWISRRKGGREHDREHEKYPIERALASFMDHSIIKRFAADVVETERFHSWQFFELIAVYLFTEKM